MNVSCPKCQTVFRVDPAKVPPRGVRARCSVCAGVFFVGHEAPAPAATLPAAPVPPLAAPVAAAPVSPPVVVPPSAVPLAAPPAAPPLVSPARPPASAAPAVPGPAAPAPPAVSPPAARPAPPVATIAATPRPAPPAPAPPAAPVSAPRRSVNPFLAQDPATKARRLARALISDLVVYHPARRAEGLRDGTLKLLFEEEIRKCWEEYTEQVGMEMATSTRFFTEALNEILADGQPVFS